MNHYILLPQYREAYKDYMRRVGDLLLLDANLTVDASTRRQRLEQFVNDAYGQEEHLSQVRIGTG